MLAVVASVVSLKLANAITSYDVGPSIPFGPVGSVGPTIGYIKASRNLFLISDLKLSDYTYRQFSHLLFITIICNFKIYDYANNQKRELLLFDKFLNNSRCFFRPKHIHI